MDCWPQFFTESRSIIDCIIKNVYNFIEVYIAWHVDVQFLRYVKIFKQLESGSRSPFFLYFTDAKGIRVGGFKVPKPKLPSVSVPKPHVPIIVPVVIPVGGFHSHGGNSYNRKNGSNNNSSYFCIGLQHSS